MTPQEAFIEILVAAMLDAVTENKLTQLKTTIQNPKTGKSELVRMVVMPEKMEHEWPKHAPLGTQTKGN